MDLDSRLFILVENLGVDFYAVADLSPAREFIREQGGQEVARYPRAISVGVALPHAIVDQLPRREERAVAVSYRHHAYDVINSRLDNVTSRLVSALGREGYRALPVSASKQVDDERICGLFSHKLAAHLAGLGWIGRNCLLVTPEVGPRARWATVLTDAPLRADRGQVGDGCGDCLACVEICPVGAFTGRIFHQAEPREMRFDARLCDAYFDQLKSDGAEGVCGLCLYVCPYGRSS